MKSESGGRSVLGWIWTVFAGIGVVGMFAQGHAIAGLLIAMSGVCALPPLWSAIAAKGIKAPTWLRGIGGVTAFVAAAAFVPQGETPSEAVTLASLESKIADDAVMEMERGEFGDTYARLGGEAFKRANRLMKWPAIAVAASPRCNSVELAAISDRATAEALEWFVDCENRERFRVTEAQAIAARDSFDADGTAQDELAVLAPESAVFDDLSEADVVSRCDIAVQSAMRSQGSFDTAWQWEFTRHPSTGRVTVVRDFEADNAFGATLSSQYECVVKAADMELVSLRIREGNGWQTLYSE